MISSIPTPWRLCKARPGALSTGCLWFTPRCMKVDMKVFSVRLAAAAATEIELAAAEARRSKAQLVRLILEDWAAGRRERGERAGGVDAR